MASHCFHATKEQSSSTVILTYLWPVKGEVRKKSGVHVIAMDSQAKVSVPENIAECACWLAGLG